MIAGRTERHHKKGAMICSQQIMVPFLRETPAAHSLGTTRKTPFCAAGMEVIWRHSHIDFTQDEINKV